MQYITTGSVREVSLDYKILPEYINSRRHAFLINKGAFACHEEEQPASIQQSKPTQDDHRRQRTLYNGGGALLQSCCQGLGIGTRLYLVLSSE